MKTTIVAKIFKLKKPNSHLHYELWFKGFLDLLHQYDSLVHF